ncbi:hypothetical protein [Thauera sp.]|uniref:hypothetical protein n=1 Tax=Thauera sp. TaxID=1905334 RepID=UPI0039E4C3A7
MADLDEKAFSTYFERRYGHSIENTGATLDQVLQNIGLGDGRELTGWRSSAPAICPTA